MNKDLIRESIESYSIQFVGASVTITYSSKIDSQLKVGYFLINEDVNFNNQELLKDMIVEDIVSNKVKTFVKENYEMLTLLNYISDDKVVKELI